MKIIFIFFSQGKSEIRCKRKSTSRKTRKKRIRKDLRLQKRIKRVVKVVDVVVAVVVEVIKMVREVEEADKDHRQQRQITRQIIGVDKKKMEGEEVEIVIRIVIASKIRTPGSTNTIILKDLITPKVHLLKTLRSQKCLAKKRGSRNHQRMTLIKRWLLMID